MKTYEITISNRKNSIGSDISEPVRMVLDADSKQAAKDLAYEIFHEEHWKMPREKVKIVAEIVK